jgi:two-component system response regulator AlgR
MKVLIVDDEPPARDRLRALLADFSDVQVIGGAGDGSAALDLIQERLPDVVISDIRMPGMNGLEMARHLSELEHAPAVIFLTAHDDHALQAFELQAVDYLLKPVRAERLRTALDRARKLHGETARGLQRELAGPRTHLCARQRGTLKLIPVADVLYFLADAKYVEVHYRGGEVLIEDSLVQLEEEFGERFVRIHRSCLVAVEFIAGLSRAGNGETVVTLRDSAHTLEVSRRNLAAVRRLIRSL